MASQTLPKLAAAPGGKFYGVGQNADTVYDTAEAAYQAAGITPPIGAPSGGIAQADIERAYQATYGRAVDPSGLKTFSDPYYAGKTFDDLVSILKQQPEYQTIKSKPDSAASAQTVLDSMTSDAFDQLTKAATPQTRSSSQIEAELSTSLAPDKAAPTRPNYLETFQKLRTEAGTDALEQSVNDLKANEDELTAQLRKLTTDERGLPILSSMISGTNAKTVRNTQEQLDFLGRQKARLTDQLTSKYNMINTIMSLTEKDYTGAKADYDDEYKRNLDMINLVQGVKNEEKSDAQQIRDNALANLNTIGKFVSDGTLVFSDLPKDQQLNINKLEIQSGLGAGFLQRITPKVAGAEIKSVTTRQAADGYEYADLIVVDKDGTIKVMSERLGKFKQAATGGGSAGTLSDAELLRAARSAIASGLNKATGQDGKVAPTTWISARQKWVSQGLSGKDFDESFASQYVDATHYQDYGVTRTLVKG